MNINVWLLFFCQALVNASSIGQVAMSALLGHAMAPDKALATLPYALQMASTMAASIPAGMIFARLGRKPGFYLGAAGSLVGCGLYAWGVMRGDFLIYCLGSIPTGLGFGIGQHYRFAAAEVADSEARPRAIGLVMAGGVLAAILGPELVERTKDLTPPLLFLGTYLALAILPLTVATLLVFVRLPPAPARVVSPTPIAEIIARPTFVTAAVAGLVGYGSMNLIMASTPLQMMLCGFGVNDSIDVIRLHAICMFAPGFFTGRLIQRFGAHRIIVVGGALTILCAGLSLRGSSFYDFVLALCVLGVGWNFMFVGATTLLSTAHSAIERVRAQAANDFIVFGTVAMTSFTSGALHAEAGWLALNAAVIPPVLVALSLVLWHRARHGRRSALAV